MNSPYMGKFRVSQQYKTGHTGLDLVGVDSKEIHSTVNGTVDYAGWENANNKKQGFGLYVVIKDSKTGYYYYFGHLSQLKVKTGQAVKVTDIIGIEGSTGYSTGSHCHYEIRKKRGVAYAGTVNVATVSGIPNAIGSYDDGYSSSSIKNYTKGDYKITATSMNVREEPNGRIKDFKELTASAQKQGGYKKDVIFTALEVKNMSGESWARTPSGWVCIYNKDGVYCVKV